MNEKQHNHEPEAPHSPEADTLADTPRIWVGSLLDYNNGVLYGEWIDGTQDEDEIRDQITTMLGRSPTTAKYGDVAEEYGIFDFDGFEGLRIDQHDSLATVTALAQGVAEHGEAFALWADDIGTRYAAEHPEQFNNSYIGYYESEVAFAEEMWTDSGYQAQLDQAVPEEMRGYVEFDVESWARDMIMGGDVTCLDAEYGGVYVFWSV